MAIEDGKFLKQTEKDDNETTIANLQADKDFIEDADERKTLFEELAGLLLAQTEI